MANPKLKPNQFLLPCGAMITERPILFSTDMVHANLVDRKTQTRRTRGLDTANENPGLWEKKGNDILVHKEHGFIIDSANSHYGELGDLLWVRETWLKIDPDHIGEYAYKATMAPESDKIRKDCIKAGRKYQWKPSIHMPKKASRIWVMVEEIRVERLQEISEEDAKAEGLCESNNPNISEFNLIINKGKTLCTGDYLFVWRSLWVSINGADSWNSNPWVWVVKYRILSKTGRPSIETIEKNYLEVTNPPRVAEPLEGSIKPNKPKP